MITFKIRGRVVDDATGAPLPGLFVKAYDEDGRFDDLLGNDTTGPAGEFDIISEPDDFRSFFDEKPDLYFKVFASDRTTLLHSTADAVKLNVGRMSKVEIRVPVAESFPQDKARLTLEGEDGEQREEFEVGDSLALTARGLKPVTPYDIVVTADEEELFVSRLLTDARGRIETTVLWPQLGLDDPSSGDRLTFDEAAERWSGRRLGIEIRHRRKPALRASFTIRPDGERPVVFSSDREGRLLNGFEIGDQDVTLLVRNLRWRGNLRVYMVPSQGDWRVGDRLEPATLADGSPAVREFEAGELGEPLRFLAADELRPGAFDFVVRPVRYGFEEDDLLRLLERDVVSGRRITGIVIRERFWEAKPVLGGCVNKMEIAGRSVSGQPYIQYTNVFEVGENVYGALDPGIIDPNNLSKMCAFYVVQNKTEPQWNANTSLTHLPVLGGNAAVPRVLVQGYCINANKVLLWPNAQAIGEYDVVADFGNNTSTAAAFTPDSSYDTPLDAIDGYFVAGFRVVNDPGTFTDPGLFAGSWSYDPAVVNGLGLSGTITFDDETGFYATPGAFSVVSRSVQMRANVFFPADMAGVTNPAQISAARPDYPLVVIVHGNGHDYTSYDFLLQHLARNGFIAASIDNRFIGGMGTPVHGMGALGRANNFFFHLEVLRARFGTKVQNNIGLMGHSRGGEAVVKIPRLNHERGLGNNIRASLPLAPTDHYGREVLASPFATPLLNVYGSRDGDVAGRLPTGTATWRRSGLSLYDRVRDAEKTSVFVYRASHNGFITTNWDAAGDSPIPEAAQRAVIQAYANGFFRRHLRNEPQWDGMLKGEWKPASVLAAGVELYTQHRLPGGRTLDDFEGGAPNWQSSTLGGAVAHAGTLPVDPEEGRLYHLSTVPGLDPQSPHDSKGLKVQWDSIGDRLTWDIPAGQRDVTGFTTLSLRITQKEASPSNPVNQVQDLRVGLRDSANNERGVRVGAFSPIPFPDQRSDPDLRKSAFVTVRIPLTSYTIVCAGVPKVNLNDVTKLYVDFSIRPAGEIEIDEIEFTA